MAVPAHAPASLSPLRSAVPSPQTGSSFVECCCCSIPAVCICPYPLPPTLHLAVTSPQAGSSFVDHCWLSDPYKLHMPVLKAPPFASLPSLQAGSSFVDHCWLSDGRLVVASSDKQLMVVEATEVVYSHTLSMAVNCMLPLPDNLLMVALAKVWMGVGPTSWDVLNCMLPAGRQPADGGAGKGVCTSIGVGRGVVHLIIHRPSQSRLNPYR